MKKKILLLMGVFAFGLLQAQVGINTNNPQGLLHVDPTGNTTGVGVGDSDDVIVTAAGRMGIGTIAPDVLLDIRTGGTPTAPIPGFRLEDGNQATDHILALNAAGIATWQNLTPTNSRVYDQLAGNTGTSVVEYTTTNYYYIGRYIDLPPGRWVLNVIVLMEARHYNAVSGSRLPIWVTATFSTSTATGTFDSVKTSDLEGSGLAVGLCWDVGYYSIFGSVVLTNGTNATKRYYNMVGGTDAFGNVANATGRFQNTGHYLLGETGIVAYRVPAGN